ncbi:MAG: DNA primase DnaG [Hadesarchaea archaeon]|nr:DNA primase DnaG [Hadesarchaea archaeon]
MREDIGTTKYLIHAKIEASGVVERPDVVGAIFGQTEGLLGDELDLRELLKTGRIGRIKVEINSNQGKSWGTVTIPSSLDRVETAIIGAALETIDRVGPCEATIKVERIEDVRDVKRKLVIDRAKKLLEAFEEVAPETQEITERVKESVRLEEIGEYEGLPAGPGVRDSDAIVIVEGRADVLNLLRAGIRNVIAIEGTSVPPAVIELSKNKTVTAFLDSDRGGDLILKELLQVTDVDFVARPPQNRSVEELTRKEIIKSLRNKVPVEHAIAEARGKPAPEPAPAAEETHDLEQLETTIGKLRGTLKALLLNERFEPIGETQVRDLRDELLKTTGVNAVVFDGVVTQEFANLAARHGVRYVVGMRSRVESVPKNTRILTMDELRRLRYRK